mgnify:CR=1 FL=1
MAQPSQIDQIAERVERLLVRHDELQRTNALLTEQVNALTLERDSLKSRLSAARARVEFGETQFEIPPRHPVLARAQPARRIREQRAHGMEQAQGQAARQRQESRNQCYLPAHGRRRGFRAARLPRRRLK